jgi:hypothetical protein
LQWPEKQRKKEVYQKAGEKYEEQEKSKQEEEKI